MNLLIMGPPGAGKGTQAETLTAKLDIPHISTGDMFRKAISEGTELGKKAKEYMDAGQLVPDEVTIGIVKERLSEEDCRKGFLLDGFPRTVPQAEALEGILRELGMELDAVLNVAVPDEKLVARLTGRRICRQCGASYHVLYNAPKQEGICDACQGELYQRSDDSEETATNRLSVYHQNTAPLIDFYAKRGLLKEIDGDRPIPEVLVAIGQALGRDWA
ncbi:MAG: adenylate kinase [Clostridia bacterium]|jgi:adenylate kinase|nr:adenylate kinase [Clostridia bacterium]